MNKEYIVAAALSIWCGDDIAEEVYATLTEDEMIKAEELSDELELVLYNQLKREGY